MHPGLKKVERSYEETLVFKRTQLRKKISFTLNRLKDKIAALGDREELEKLLGKIRKLVIECEQVNDQLCDNYLDEETATKEWETQEMYGEKEMEAGSIVRKYLAGLESVPKPNLESLPKAEETKPEIVVPKYQKSEIPVPESFVTPRTEAGNNDLPDSWIDGYVQGIRPVYTEQEGYKGTIRSTLETYDGSPLKWLEWIDSFRAMVHDTQMQPAEKFGVLKQSLRGKCTLSISGIGGGETAYR